MKAVIEWLKEYAEVIGLVLTVVGGLYSLYGAMGVIICVVLLGLTVHLYNAFIMKVKQELERLNEALRVAEAKSQGDSQLIAELRSQIERLQIEIKRKEEVLRQYETRMQNYEQRIADMQNRLEQKQRELERVKTKKKSSVMNDTDFLELCRSGNAGQVEDTLIEGTNINATDSYGNTALMLAAVNGHTKVAEILLNHDASVNARNNDGRTALILAAWNGYTEVAELLLKHGANVNAKDSYAWTALMRAKWGKHTKTIQLLRSYNAK